MHPAFVILDAQNDFFGEDNPNLRGFLKTVAVINRVIAHFHAQGWPVIFSQHVSDAKPSGSPDWQIYPGFQREARDAAVEKTRANAFAGSELHARLQKQQVDTLLLAGYLTELCVFETCQAALGLGYRVRILQGGTANLKVDPLNKVV